MVQGQQVIEEVGYRREGPAYRIGWEDGRFGPTETFLENPNLAGWASPPKRGWRTTGATATGGGSADAGARGPCLTPGAGSPSALFTQPRRR